MIVGNNLLYLVLALLLSFLVLSGLLSEAVIRDLEVHRFLPKEAFAESATPLAVEITNPHRLMPAYAFVVEDFARMERGDEGPFSISRVFVLHVGARTKKTCTYFMRPPRRGPVRFVGYRVSTRFPFGLFSKALFVESPDQMLVFPAIHASAAHPPTVEDPGHESAQRTVQRQRGAEASTLRSFIPGDHFRHIHWAASLRSKELLVRSGESTHAVAAEVQLKTRGVAEGAGFELQVSRAASEIARLSMDGVAVGLRTDSTHLPASHTRRSHLLSFLATVDPEPSNERGAA